MQCVLARLTYFGLMWALSSLRGLYLFLHDHMVFHVVAAEISRCRILHLKCQVLARLKCQILSFKCQVLFTFEVPGFVLQVPGFDHFEVPGFALQVPGFVLFQVPGFVLFPKCQVLFKKVPENVLLCPLLQVRFGARRRYQQPACCYSG